MVTQLYKIGMYIPKHIEWGGDGEGLNARNTRKYTCILKVQQEKTHEIHFPITVILKILFYANVKFVMCNIPVI